MPSTPRSAASRRSRRVSSAATTSASASAARNRCDASAGLPSGAPARTSVPVPAASLTGPVSQRGAPGRRERRPYDGAVATTYAEARAPDSAYDDVEPAQRSLRERFAPPMPDDRLWGWLGPGIVTLLAAFLRFDRLRIPHGVVFDEVYYSKDSHDLLRHGVELNQEGTGPGFVVHPPLGKWAIALGEKMFGYNEFGWRFSAAVAGTVSVLIMCRVARRMTRSTLLGCFAGVL